MFLQVVKDEEEAVPEDPDQYINISEPSCAVCGYTAVDTADLRQHKMTQHGAKFPCTQCGYVASNSTNLKRHKQTVHEGMTYPCDQCDQVFTQMHHFREHRETVHDNIKFPCDHPDCQYTANGKSALRKHKKFKHGVSSGKRKKMPCDYCDYRAKGREELKAHMRRRHKDVSSDEDWELRVNSLNNDIFAKLNHK